MQRRLPMRTLGTLLVMLALLTTLPQAAAHQTVYGTTSTGDQDTWGIPDPSLGPGGMCGYDFEKFHVETVCLLEPCPQDIYTFTVRLELVDPSPGDVVALSVLGDAWSLGESIGGSMQIGDPTTFSPQVHTYPTEVATYDDPVADIQVTLGGCNRATTAIVSGVVVDGEASYRLTY